MEYHNYENLGQLIVQTLRDNGKHEELNDLKYSGEYSHRIGVGCHFKTCLGSGIT